MRAKVGDERLHRQTRGLLYSQAAGKASAVSSCSVMRKEGLREGTRGLTEH